ncbi:TPM domain-containing protein [Luteolibacter ambystomatis]|uniref:TPM domain-containing protein n=1 Tax=Luteolibacter ambystomatis TaxID=2824561 RepID=A0A975J120_9BACT|nr:TPM domain-containing protein [Luteolibacter ambystomatis]QUE52068.1 TPM domain-containing protein [Luteolibacter ambystomatis]
MCARPDETPRYSAQRFAAGKTVCPSCLVHLPQAAAACPSCRFSGEDTMKMFPHPLPPLQPVLDAANLWSESERSTIVRRVKKTRHRFPQIHWSLCTLDAAAIDNPRLFGFWMLNASPLAEGETADQRAWTVLMVINGATGKAAIVPGYGVEPWLSDDQWHKLLLEMTVAWGRGRRGLAVVKFFDAAERLLRRACRQARKKLRHQER